ncbi:MAG: caspase family protein [Planctomycetaceae bacterium]|nr:caspase family protein [Planctomycetaceae bacterium]
MLLRSTIFVALGYAVCCGAAAAEIPPSSPEVPATHRRRALLVGCSEYPTLGERYRLRGPANDVGLIERLLRERFQFASDEIVRLPHATDKARQPTRTNILREFDTLAADARPGDEIVVFLAGHGSQVPDDSLDEDDGLDEVFLPEDVTLPGTKATGAASAVPGIRDDEIEAKLSAMRSRGAFVFFIADTCHSGTMSRGLEDHEGASLARHVPRELLTSDDELNSAANRARGPDRPREQLSGDAATVGGLAAIYAVPATALELEQPMPPPGGADRPFYGRLTYCLYHVLAQAEQPLTYRELAQRAAWQYGDWDFHLLPLLEGNALDREVLGKREWRDRSAIIVTADAGGALRLNQGAAHGLTRGTVLKAFPPKSADESAPAANFVVVREVSPFTARVERVHDGATRRSDGPLPTPARCEVVEVDESEAQIGVCIAAATPADRESADVLRAQLEEWIAAEPALVRLARPGESADVVLTVDGGSARLTLRCRPISARAERTNATPSFGPYPIEAGARPAAADDLRRIAVAYNLMRLAADDEPAPGTKFAAGEVGLSVTVERRRGDDKPWRPLDAAMGNRLTKGDRVRITLRNVGVSRVDATVLYIESAMRIQSCFPTAQAALTGAYNTLAAGQSREVVLSINDKTVGREDILILAVAHTPPLATYFAFLEQPGLTVADLRRERGESAAPLDRLLKASLSGARRTRTVEDAKTYAVRRIPLEVQPAPSVKSEHRKTR